MGQSVEIFGKIFTKRCKVVILSVIQNIPDLEILQTVPKRVPERSQRGINISVSKLKATKGAEVLSQCTNILLRQRMLIIKRSVYLENLEMG